MAIWSIIHFTLLPDYKIEVSFADGTSGIAYLAPRLSQGPLWDGFDPFCDENLFSQVFLGHGALTWPGGIDLAPDAMYQRIRATGTSVLAAKKQESRLTSDSCALAKEQSVIGGDTIATGLEPHDCLCMTIGDKMNRAADCCPKLALSAEDAFDELSDLRYTRLRIGNREI